MIHPLSLSMFAVLGLSLTSVAQDNKTASPVQIRVVLHDPVNPIANLFIRQPWLLPDHPAKPPTRTRTIEYQSCPTHSHSQLPPHITPILVQLSSAAGHGMGTALAERIAENADVLAFLFNELGMTPAQAPDFERSV